MKPSGCTDTKNAFAADGVTQPAKSREGDKLILKPVRKSWLTLNDDSEPVGDDFVDERPELFAMDPGRADFE